MTHLLSHGILPKVYSGDDSDPKAFDASSVTMNLGFLRKQDVTFTAHTVVHLKDSRQVMEFNVTCLHNCSGKNDSNYKSRKCSVGRIGSSCRSVEQTRIIFK